MKGAAPAVDAGMLYRSQFSCQDEKALLTASFPVDRKEAAVLIVTMNTKQK
jgi:hypothetical protein